MKKSLFAIVFLVVSVGILRVHAKTVAWWPLAAEEGVRTTTDTALVNKATPGTLDAYPISMVGAAIVDGGESCPVGTAAFPSGWGVWDPETRTVETGATGLYFKKTSLAGNAGALRVADPVALRLQTFTFEVFVKMDEGTEKSEWNCIAVMPGKLKTTSGADVLNYDSWAIRVTAANKFQLRFTKPSAAATDLVNVSAHNLACEVAVGNPGGLYDGRWHHLAFVVSQSDKKAHAYYDYVYMNSVNLPDGLSYGAEDLFIGSTPQTTGPFGGSLAHMRISDTVLAPNEFLQLTDIAGEAEDVVLHADFETPAGLSSQSNAPLNRARGGLLLTVRDASGKPIAVEETAPATETTYASRVAADGVANSRSLVCGGTSKTYAKFTPDGNTDFQRSSFTVECFYRTVQTATYVPLVRRRGGSNVQFNLGFGAAVGKLSATVLEYYATSGGDGAKAVTDSEATNDGQWHHAALVVDSVAKRMTLFRDGRPIGSQPYNGTLVAHTTPVCIGGIDTDKSAAFGGSIDDVRITMRALKPGEFLCGSHFDVTQTTLGWVGFDGSVNGLVPDGVLTGGIAEKAAADGTEPAFVAHGRNPRLIDGNGTVLREDNVKSLALDKGVVKYPDNVLLPLIPEQTVEFFVKGGAQAQYAGIVRCNVNRDSADVPVWAISVSGDAADGQCRNLRIRCATQNEAGSIDERAVDEDTPAEIGDGRRHHVALTMKQTSGDEGQRQTALALYMDYSDEPVWTKTVSGWFYYGTGSASVWLGASSSATAFFKGSIDELRISQGILQPMQFLRFAKSGLSIAIR